MYADDTAAAVTLRFSWIIEGRLAASALPGKYGPFSDHVSYLADKGIQTIINLSEKSYAIPDSYNGRIRCVHIPLPDGDAPTARQMERILEIIEREAFKGERPCLAHCRGGVGRTATVIAPALMRLKGMTMEGALGLLRQSGRRTETMRQYRFLEAWAEREGTGSGGIDQDQGA